MAGKRKQKVTPRALMELKMPGDVQIAPDSRRIAYSVSETDWENDSVTQHLWVTTTAADSVPRQVTRGLESESDPRWSPDGKWLAFLTRREEPGGVENFEEEADEEPKQQVWLLPMDGAGGEAEKLTDAPEGIGAYEWLPDSSGIIYLAREPRPKPLQTVHEEKAERKDDAVLEREERFRQQLWQIGTESKKPKLVHPGDFGIGELAVSPDGKTIAFTTNYTGEVNDYHQSDVLLAEMETGKVHPLTQGPGGKFHPRWAQDGASVFYTSTLDPDLSYSQQNLFSVRVYDREMTNLTANFPHDLTGWHPYWLDHLGHLFVIAALGTRTAIFRREEIGFQPLVENDEHIHNAQVAPNGGIAYVASSSEDVPELYWLGPGMEQAEALTDLNEAWYEKYALARSEVVSWHSEDGLKIEALLTFPGGYDTAQAYPLIVSLHGGPHGRMVQSLSPYTTAQVYAAEGYAVLAPNYRGSEGYGSAFSTANRHDLGGGDAQDVLNGVRWAIQEGIADPRRLGVTGSSYGGYLVNWLIGQTPLFHAAISKFGIFSLTTDFSNSQAPRWELEYLGGYPWDKPELYTQRSPASYVKDIQTPVLLLHGEGDPNTFIANSQEMYQALRLLHKPVQYVHYPREGHGFAEPQHRLDEMGRCLAWFDRYLSATAEPTVHRLGEKLVSQGWELVVASAELAVYAGRADVGTRHIEITFVLRDTTETQEPLTIGPSDLALSRGLTSSTRIGRPVGLPIDVLGQKVLAEGAGWKFNFTPAKEERRLAVPLAVTFRITDAAGPYAFAVKEFPPVTLEIPAADEKDEDKKKESLM